jgi:hypothetical protein
MVLLYILYHDFLIIADARDKSERTPATLDTCFGARR